MPTEQPQRRPAYRKPPHGEPVHVDLGSSREDVSDGPEEIIIDDDPPPMAARRRAQPSRPTAGGRRSDPVGRPLDGSAQWSFLTNRRKGRHYVFANTGPGDYNVQFYLEQGYEVEEYKIGGVHPRKMSDLQMTHLLGQPIVCRGFTLMSCSEERYQEIVEEGHDGQSGMAAARERRRRISNKRGLPGDETLGDTGNWSAKHFKITNSTTVEQ